MRGEAAGDPQERPAARIIVAGLGEEQECAAGDGDQEPGEKERASFFEKTGAAQRTVERQRREHCEREKADCRERNDVTSRKVPRAQIDAVGDEPCDDDEQRIENPHRHVEQRRALLEQASVQ